MVIGRAVVYYPRAAHTFSAGIKCRHCMCVVCLSASAFWCYTCYVYSFTSAGFVLDEFVWARNFLFFNFCFVSSFFVTLSSVRPAFLSNKTVFVLNVIRSINKHKYKYIVCCILS